MDEFLLTICFVLIINNFVSVCHGQEGEKMTFSMPAMTDEEQHSQHVPYNLKCDACTAVAYQVLKICLRCVGGF